MARKDKRLERLLVGKAGATFSFDELRAVLLDLGFEERTPSGSSHYTYSHPDIPEILTVPRQRPLKPVYVRKARTLILANGLHLDDRN